MRCGKNMTDLNRTRSIEYLKGKIAETYSSIGNTSRVSPSKLPAQLRTGTSKLVIDLNKTLLAEEPSHKNIANVNGLIFLTDDKLINYSLNDNSLPVLKNIRLFTINKYTLNIIDLPKSTLSRIASFFNKGPDLTMDSFNCITFALFLKGVRFTMPVNYSDEYLDVRHDLSELGEDEYFDVRYGLPELGELVAIGKTNKQNLIVDHLALYFGKNLYFSKLNKGGPVVATTMEEMRKFYETSCLWAAFPK